MFKKKIKIKYFNNAKELEIIEKGNWIDVYSNEDIIIEKGHTAIIKLGFALELPKGYEGHLVPRSSTFKTWGLIQTNSLGIVDTSYCGDNDEWCMPVYCLKEKQEKLTENGMVKFTKVKKGDKIGQFRIVKSMPKIKFIKVHKLLGKNRGGFGTTGTK